MEKSTMATWEYVNTAPQRGSENYSIEYIDAEVMYLDDVSFSREEAKQGRMEAL